MNSTLSLVFLICYWFSFSGFALVVEACVLSILFLCWFFWTATSSPYKLYVYAYPSSLYSLLPGFLLLMKVTLSCLSTYLFWIILCSSKYSRLTPAASVLINYNHWYLAIYSLCWSSLIDFIKFLSWFNLLVTSAPAPNSTKVMISNSLKEFTELRAFCFKRRACSTSYFILSSIFFSLSVGETGGPTDLEGVIVVKLLWRDNWRGLKLNWPRS